MSEGDETNPSKVTRYQIEIFPNEVRAKYMEFKNLHDIWRELGVNLDSQNNPDQYSQPDIATEGNKENQAIYGLTPSGFEKMMTLKLELMDYELPPKHKDTEARRAIVLAYLREDIEDHILSFPDITIDEIKSRVLTKYQDKYSIKEEELSGINSALEEFERDRQITKNFELPQLNEQKGYISEICGLDFDESSHLFIEKAADHLIVHVSRSDDTVNSPISQQGTRIDGMAFVGDETIPRIIVVYDNTEVPSKVASWSTVTPHERWHVRSHQTARLRNALIKDGLERRQSKVPPLFRFLTSNLHLAVEGKLERLKEEVLARMTEDENSIEEIPDMKFYSRFTSGGTQYMEEAKDLVKAAPDLINRLTAILKTNQATPRRFRRAFYILAHTRFADWSTMVDAIEEAYAPK